MVVVHMLAVEAVPVHTTVAGYTGWEVAHTLAAAVALDYRECLDRSPLEGLLLYDDRWLFFSLRYAPTVYFSMAKITSRVSLMASGL
jgi:hypothetical protein